MINFNVVANDETSYLFVLKFFERCFAPVGRLMGLNSTLARCFSTTLSRHEFNVTLVLLNTGSHTKAHLSRISHLCQRPIISSARIVPPVLLLPSKFAQTYRRLRSCIKIATAPKCDGNKGQTRPPPPLPHLRGKNCKRIGRVYSGLHSRR